MKKVFSLLFFNLLLFAAYGQDHLVKWKENTFLTWQDFLAAPPPGDPYGATANTGISFGYQYSRMGDKMGFNFEVNTYFDKNSSWSQKAKQSPELLKHEQLHFDITELQARRLRKAFASATFTDNYKVEIKQIYEAHMKAMEEMQQRYDQESEHSLNHQKEAEWEAYVRAELEKSKTEAISPTVGLKVQEKVK